MAVLRGRVRRADRVGRLGVGGAGGGGSAAFDPADLAGLVYRIDPGSGTYQERGATTTPAAADLDPVGTVVPVAGAANLVAVAADTRRPALRTAGNGLNGLSVLQFDGTSDVMAANFTLAQPYTRVAVWRHGSVQDGNHVMLGGNTVNTAFLYFVSAGRVEMYAGGAGAYPAVTGLSNATWYSSAEVFDGASSGLRVNGGSAGTAAGAGTATPNGVAVGAYSSTPNFFADMSLAYLLVYSRALASGEQDQLFAWLRTRFGHY